MKNEVVILTALDYVFVISFVHFLCTINEIPETIAISGLLRRPIFNETIRIELVCQGNDVQFAAIKFWLIYE